MHVGCEHCHSPDALHLDQDCHVTHITTVFMPLCKTPDTARSQKISREGPGLYLESKTSDGKIRKPSKRCVLAQMW